MPRVLMLLLIFFMNTAHLLADEPADSRPALLRTTTKGVAYAVWPEQPAAPAPTLFIFAGAASDALNNAYFRQCGNQLAKAGYLCVSVDLPCHGAQVREGEPAGIDGWTARLEQGEDFVAEATGRFRQVLDELIELNWTDPQQVAACGTSRGGFMAVQFAAAEPRIQAVAAFAPVTDLMVLREFQSLNKRELADRLSLKQQADRLIGRAVWLIIGDRDDRVSTEESIAFCRAVTAASLQAKQPAQVDLHVVAEPQGHTTPPGAAELAAVWITQQLARPK